jgi:probable dihydroxyacetone kinase regulator
MNSETSSLRTKQALAAALKEKMKTKPFSKITVRELIEECGVNRKTFYYHFQDIYALLRWLFEEEAIQVIKQFNLLLDWEDAIGFTCDYIQENRDVLQCACQSIGRDILKRFFFSDFIGIIESVVSDSEKRMNRFLPSALKSYYCKFLTEAIAGMMLSYIEEDYSYSRQDSIDNITVILRTSITGLLLEMGAKDPPACS